MCEGTGPISLSWVWDMASLQAGEDGRCESIGSTLAAKLCTLPTPGVTGLPVRRRCRFAGSGRRSRHKGGAHGCLAAVAWVRLAASNIWRGSDVRKFRGLLLMLLG